MMCKKMMYLVSLIIVLGTVSTNYGDVVVVGDFESGLQGWYSDTWTAGTVSVGTTGATSGSQALQVDGPGGWQQLTKVDAKPHLAVLATKGVKITADVTAFEADMTTTWMQVGMVLNCQNNDDNGAYNNLGWIDLGSQDLARDGQPHTITWVVPDAATDNIAGADDNIGWFEFLLISNVDSASVVKFYVDNIQISYPNPTTSVVVGDFEGGLDGWWAADATLSFSTTGATLNAQALQVDGPGDWHQNAKLDLKPHRVALGQPGATITADVTAFDADMTTTWMNVEMVINGQNNDDNGANNNIGWQSLGSQDVTRDGQPQKLTWVLPEALTTAISGVDDNIGWFELVLVSNLDGASVTKFYIDNIQLTYEAAPPVTDKSTDVIIGNWEQDMDGWVVAGAAEPLFNDHNGVTLDNYSLDVYIPNGDYQTFLTLDIIGNGLLDIFKINKEVSVDVTRLVADFPTDKGTLGWDGIHLVINAGGNGWSIWQDMGYQAHHSLPQDADLTQTATWDYGQYLGEFDFDDITWLEFQLISNANDSAYTGWVLFYLDNMKLFGGGAALEPQPANGAIDVPIDSTLSWTEGTFATSHHVYFGTNRAKVNNADMDSDPDVVFAALDANSFDPNGLEFKTQYFWRVDEVNEANPDSPWKGLVWNFTTGNFIVVDDFEDYNADENRIWYSWHDGLGYGTPDTDPYFAGNGTGSGSGDDTTPSFCEETIVHSGGKSMPVYFNNTGAAMISEVDRTWQEPQDWTINSFNALKLYTHGALQNIAGELYVIVEDNAGNSAKVTNTDSTIFTVEEWKEWVISFSELANSNVNMTAVTKLLIGVQNVAGQPGANGKFYIDDIRIGFKPVGLVAYYAFDNNVEDSSGNGHNGTLTGDPNFPVAYVDGPAGFGQAALFDGADDGHQYVDLGTFNPSAATDQLSIALWVKWDGPSGSWQGLIGKRQAGDWDREIMMWYFELERDAWDIGFHREGSGIATGQMLEVGQWTHVAVTFDGTTAKVYIDGVVVGEGSFSFGNDTEAPMQIGAAAENGGNPFNGTLDEVRLYDIVLSEAEILQLAGK